MKLDVFHKLSMILTIVATYGSAADWSPKQIAKMSQDLMTARRIPCVAVHSDPENMQDALLIVKQMQSESRTRFQMMRCMTMTRKSSYSNRQWGDCSHILFVMLARLPNASTYFQNIITNTGDYEATWLTFLPSALTAEKFIGEADIPFANRILTVLPSDILYVLHEHWRITSGNPIKTVLYATWSEKLGLMCINQCMYHYRNDLEGYPMRAATKEDMPLSVLTVEDDVLGIGGYFGDIYYEIVNQLNATPVVVPASQNVTGFQTEGRWNGLIGMLQREEIDLAVGPLSVHGLTLTVANFVRPLLRTNYQVFFKQSGTVVEWDAWLKPFAKYVWHVILLWFIVAGIILNHFYRIGVQLGEENRLFTWEHNKINAILAFVRSFSNQGTDLMPHSWSCRSLYLTGYLTSSIIITAYSAQLISKLTTQVPVRPFDSLETFLKDGSYKLTAIGASTDYTYFSEANDPTLKEIYDRQMLREQLPTGKEEGLMAVCERDKTALFITFGVTQISAKTISNKHKCPILWFSSPLGTVFLTIGIRKKMPYASLITQEVQTMAERGILRRLQGKEWPPQGGTEKIESRQVEISQVAQIHAVLLAGIALSLLILLAERLHATLLATNLLSRVRRRLHVSADTVVTALVLAAAVFLLTSLILGLA